MNFRKRSSDAPEINLIPFIDVLLVVLIFLMLSTTYSKFTELQLTLPQADTEAHKNNPKEVVVGVGSDGTYSLNQKALAGRGTDSLTAALKEAAQGAKDVVLIISADANARHQSVVTAMEAAQRAGLVRITFATQSTARPGQQ
ncbi:MAG: biopolymer transporter ExbD [Rhodoferax sp.]|nr:biopolymer transporter ExbD [Rhodoferax sp.]